AAVSRELRRAGNGKERIDNRDARPKVITEHAYLDLVFAVGQDGSGGDFRAGSGSCRHTDQWQDRSWNLIIAHVIAQFAAMRQYRRGDLRQIHVAAATQPENAIRAKTPAHFDAAFGCSERGLGLATGE